MTTIRGSFAPSAFTPSPNTFWYRGSPALFFRHAESLGGWSFWEPHDNEHLAHCEEVVVLRLDGWRESEGVQAELDAAAALGKPVRYLDANESIPVEAGV